MTTPSFSISNTLEELQESGLAGLVVNDQAVASSKVLWTSAKINSLPAPPGAMALVPGAVTGDVSTFGVGGQVVDSGKLLSSFPVISGAQTLGNLISFGPAAGEIQDSGQSIASLVAAPPTTVVGDIAVFSNTTGQLADSGQLLSTLGVKPAFAKYSAPVQAIGLAPSTVLFSTLVGSSSLTGSTGTIAVAAGVVTLTSSTAVASSWKIDFNPNFVSNVLSSEVSFQFQTPTGTDSGNTSQAGNTVLANPAFGNGIISEFLTVPASSSATLQINATATVAATDLGLAPSSLPYISILQIS